jgi:hypothetical protein
MYGYVSRKATPYEEVVHHDFCKGARHLSSDRSIRPDRMENNVDP